MQQSGMNYLYTKVSAVREQLILFANQIESLDFEYNAVVAELEQSFTDSKGFWERTTAEQKTLHLIMQVLRWNDSTKWQMA